MNNIKEKLSIGDSLKYEKMQSKLKEMKEQNLNFLAQIKSYETVRAETESMEQSRQIPRIFPLELQVNEIDNEKEGKEESGSGKPSDIKTVPNDVILEKYTSSGRCVKVPKRLDLLNNVCYTFETLPKSQRGGGCCEMK